MGEAHNQGERAGECHNPESCDWSDPVVLDVFEDGPGLQSSSLIGTDAVEAPEETTQAEARHETPRRSQGGRKPMSVAAETLPLFGPEARPELLKPDEMAQLLRVSRSTLDRWSRRPGFPVIRQPHLVLFPWRKVMEYMERTAVEGGQLPSRADERNAKRRK